MSTTQIEDFLYMFRADNSSLKKGAEESTQAVKKTEQALNLVDKAANKAGGSFLHFASIATASLASIFAIGEVIGKVFELSDKNSQLGLLSKSLKISTEDLGAWGDAAEKFGGSNSDTTGSIEGLNKQMQVLALTGTSRVKKVFEGLGISVKDSNGHVKTTLGLMDELSDKFKQIGSEKALGIGQRLGLDKATIMMMSDGKTKLHELLNEEKKLGEPTAEDAKAALEFKHSLMDLEHIGRTVATAIGTFLFPALNAFLDVIVKTFMFIKENGFLIESIIMAIAGAFIFLKGEALIGLIKTIYKAVAGFLAMDAAALLIPLAIAAFIALIALAIQDILIWANGGKSAIGHYLGAFVDFKDKVFKIWDGIKEKIGSIWDGAKQHAQSFFDWVFSHFEMLMGFAKKVSEFFHLGGGNATQIGQSANGLLSAASSSPLNAITSNSITGGSNVSKQTHVTIQKVEVNTQATDADGISKVIGGHLTTHLRNAQDQFDDGVKK